MDYCLGNFDTIFHLFAAIYIATTGYDTIIKRVLNHVETKVVTAKNRMEDFSGTINSTNPDITDIFGLRGKISGDLKKILLKLNYFSLSYKEERSDLYRDLFINNGLYLIIILIYSGIEKSQDGLNYLALIIVNIYVILNFMFLFRRTYIKKEIPYKRLKIAYVVLFIILVIIIHHISFVSCQNIRLIADMTIQYESSIKMIAVIFSLVLAVFSYLIFILRFLYIDLMVSHYNTLVSSPKRFMKKSLKQITENL